VRVWTAQNSNDATRISDLTYSYAGDDSLGDCPTAPVGVQTSLRWVEHDMLTNVYTNYCYDSANRLTQDSPGVGATYYYSYDANGNRTETRYKDGTLVQSQTVNAADQLTMTGYSYDAAGNTTADSHGTEAWNAAGQMTTLTNGSGSHSYTYAGTDQTELISDGNGRNYTYGRSGSTGLPLIESFTKSGNTYSYLYDPNGTPLAIEGGNTHYLALDGLGSIIATIKHDGTTTATYSYDAWGQQTTTAHNGSSIDDYQLYGYTGGITDPLAGLLHLGHRWYDSHNGRFSQQDNAKPLADPARANRYAYAGDNPVNYVDPCGLSVGGCVKAIVEFILTAAGAVGAIIAVLAASPEVEVALAVAEAAGFASNVFWSFLGAVGSAFSLTDIIEECF
jgi:RHS repeat-associated protein